MNIRVCVLSAVAVVSCLTLASGIDRDKLKMYFENGDVPTADQFSLLGTGFSFGYQYAEGGDNGQVRKLIGPTKVGNITMSGHPNASSRIFFNWVASAVNRDVKRMSGRIVSVNANGTDQLGRITFADAYPSCVRTPALDALAMEASPFQFTLSCGDIKNNLPPASDKIKKELAVERERMTRFSASFDGVEMPVLQVEPMQLTMADPRIIHHDDSDDVSSFRSSSLIITVPAETAHFYEGLMNSTQRPPRVLFAWGGFKFEGVMRIPAATPYAIDTDHDAGVARVKFFFSEPVQFSPG